jgi:MSHA biogenesis protein MshN
VRLASILALARLKVERNQAPAALELLQKNAAAGESSAEYQGFAGALLNRAGRAAEAVERYQAAVRLAPGEARWWAGLGIALDSAGRTVEAREAYQKARALPGLPADLAQHIDQRLR